MASELWYGLMLFSWSSSGQVSWQSCLKEQKMLEAGPESGRYPKKGQGYLNLSKQKLFFRVANCGFFVMVDMKCFKILIFFFSNVVIFSWLLKHESWPICASHILDSVYWGWVQYADSIWSQPGQFTEIRQRSDIVGS